MLDSLTSKIAGIPAYLWVLLGAGGLYWYAHRQSRPKVQGVAPLELKNSKQTAGPISPTAVVVPYGPQPAGVFGGSNPWSGGAG